MTAVYPHVRQCCKSYFQASPPPTTTIHTETVTVRRAKAHTPLTPPHPTPPVNARCWITRGGLRQIIRSPFTEPVGLDLSVCCDTCQPSDVKREDEGGLIQATETQSLLHSTQSHAEAHVRCTRLQTFLCIGPVGFLDITSLTLLPQRMPASGFLLLPSTGKTCIFITAEPVAPHNLFLLVSSSLPCQSSRCCHSGSASELSCRRG